MTARNTLNEETSNMLTKSVSEALSKVQTAGKARIDAIGKALEAESVARPVARFLGSRPKLRASYDRFTKAVDRRLVEDGASPKRKADKSGSATTESSRSREGANSGDVAQAN